MYGGNVPPTPTPDLGGGGGGGWHEHDEKEKRERERRKRILEEEGFMIEFLKTATNIINNQ